MEKGTKIVIGVVGGLVLATGLAIAVYQLTKSKVVTNNSGGNNPQPDNGPTPPAKGSAAEQALDALNLLLNGYTEIKAFTAESFPLRAGMKGPNVKLMQSALVNKFNQLHVKQDGIFGVQTFQALKATGYATLIDNTIDKSEFDNIIAGVKKS